MTENDKALLERKGISEEKLQDQLASFAKGFPFLRLSGAAAVGKGIISPQQEDIDKYLSVWDHYTAADGHRVVKFVPASGAASRMFKDMFAFVDASYDTPETPFEKKFFSSIDTAAFLADLNATCVHVYLI